MTLAPPARRVSEGALRFGYLIGAVVDAVLLYLINIRPGWQAVPLLTDDARLVLGLVNFCLAVGLATNIVYLAYHPDWFKTMGDLLTTGIILAVVIRFLRVLPFDVHRSWAVAIRVLLVLAIAGTAIGMVVYAVALARWVVRRCRMG